jgi:hypothetical protein
MSFAYKLNEDVLHRPQRPQGRAVADPPMIYTIVQCMPLRQTDVLDTASNANQRILSE